MILPAIKDMQIKQHIVEGDYVATVFDMETTDGIDGVFDRIRLLDGEVKEIHGDRIAAALGDRKAVVLQNHGLLTVGRTVDESAWWFITMDRCCQSKLMAKRWESRS